VLDTLNSERYMDESIPEVYADLLNRGKYLCSQRTMYRILEANQAVRERRDQRRHPEYTKPELLATAPNQVWSWDITNSRGPGKGPTTTCMSLWTFTRDVLWAGWWPARNRQLWLKD